MKPRTKSKQSGSDSLSAYLPEKITVKNLNARIPTNLFNEVKRIAKSKGCKINELVEAMVRRLIDEENG